MEIKTITCRPLVLLPLLPSSFLCPLGRLTGNGLFILLLWGCHTNYLPQFKPFLSLSYSTATSPSLNCKKAAPCCPWNIEIICKYPWPYSELVACPRCTLPWPYDSWGRLQRTPITQSAGKSRSWRLNETALCWKLATWMSKITEFWNLSHPVFAKCSIWLTATWIGHTLTVWVRSTICILDELIVEPQTNARATLCDNIYFYCH